MATSTSYPPAPLPIETARLILRKPEEKEGVVYAAMMTNPLNIEHDPEHDGPAEPTPELHAEQIVKHGKAYEQGLNALTCVVLKNPDGSEGPVIGMAGFPFTMHNANGRPGNTGCLIDSAYARKGYATEALIATLDYGYDVLGFEVVEQTTHEANTQYRGLMKSMGLEKYCVKLEQKDGQAAEVNYPVSRSEWALAKKELEARLKEKRQESS